MQIIFRDDDTSFFTRPAMLERVYAPVWERDVPVSLATIPAHSARIQLRNEENHFDPNVPPDHRGQDGEFPITGNAELCAYLNEKIAVEQVEIALHGYSHSWMELVNDDAAWISDRLAVGRRILNEAFPCAAIETCLSPYGNISQAALDTLLAEGWHFTAKRSNWPTLPMLAALPENRCLLQPNGGKLYARGNNGDPLADPQGWIAHARTLLDTDATLTILNHYWMFFDEWGPLKQDQFDVWQRFLDGLFALEGIEFTTFNRGRPVQAQQQAM